MEDDTGAEDDERTVELSTTAAIFPELFLDPGSPYRATLDLPVSPASPLRIRFQQLADSIPPILPTPPTSTEAGDDENIASEANAAIPTSEVYEIAHLPPLHLKIYLPEGYPSEKSPVFTLSSAPAWVPKKVLEDLEADGARLWEELGKDQVVFAYIDHLQQAADRGFDLTGQLHKSIQLSSGLKLELLDFDLKTKRELFEKETFDCGICLEPKKGVNCYRLLFCSHVFCVVCLQDFYNACITEGDIDNVKCLDPSCGKDVKLSEDRDGTKSHKDKRRQDRTLNPSELLQIPLEQEKVQRYVRLKRKKRLESDKETIYCPRQWCQGAARSKKHPKPIDPLADAGESVSESEVEQTLGVTIKKSKKLEPEDPPMSERLCICEDCSFAFCSVCKKGWHGELSVCNPRRQAELNEEELASQDYLKMHTTPCPTCSAPCQKTLGCNHMICYKCRTHFCYLCSSYLTADNPYRHFNDLKSTCYMRLWELEGGDGDHNEVGIGFAGGRNWESDSDDVQSEGEASEGEGPAWEFDGEDEVIVGSDEESEDGADPRPAPEEPQNEPRDFRIEIVNFARAGAANQHIIQNMPRNPRANPPPAPAPPRRDAQRRLPAGRARLPRAIPALHHAPRDLRAHVRAGARDQLEEHDSGSEGEDEGHVDMIRAAPAPGQGNGGAQQPAPVRAMGLERFLELAQRDEEDEWDSDELEDVEGPPPVRAGARQARGQ